MSSQADFEFNLKSAMVSELTLIIPDGYLVIFLIITIRIMIIIVVKPKLKWKYFMN